MAAYLTAPPTTPADPARVNPLHLPALAHVASDVDGIAAPVRIVNATLLGECDTCTHGDGDIPVLGSIGTVIAYDPDAHTMRDTTCALHLDPTIRDHARQDRHVVVEIPTGSRQWFETSPRETYFALDESRAIAVARTRIGGWAAWEVVGDSWPVLLATFPADEGDQVSRGDAECWAQAHAATLAADAFEAGHVLAELTELHPVRALVGVA